jgi:hypothetical protein
MTESDESRWDHVDWRLCFPTLLLLRRPEVGCLRALWKEAHFKNFYLLYT